MSKPITITIPHSLGRAEAQKRIAEGFASIAGQLGPQAANGLKSTWAGDRMDFSAQAMGQSIQGHAVVRDDAVDMEIALPAMLSMMAGMVKDRVSQQGRLMLEKKT